jgi:hypothetical protein
MQQQQSNWPEYRNLSYNSQSWSAQQQNNWPEYSNSWRQSQRPVYSQARHARSAGNYSSSDYTVDGYSSAYEAQPYQPRYANRPLRNEHSNSHRYSRPARAPGSGSRNNGRCDPAYTRLEPYEVQRDQYDQDHPYPNPPGYSDPPAFPRDTAPLVPHRASGIEPSEAAELIPANRQPSHQPSDLATQGHNGADMYDETTCQYQVQPDQMEADQGASAQSQPLPVDVKEAALDAVDDTTNDTRHHDVTMPRISKDLLRRLSESDMQVVTKAETTEPDRAPADAVVPAADPTQASVDTGAAPVGVTAEQAEDVQVQNVSVSTPTVSSSENANANRVTPEEVIHAPGDPLLEVFETLQSPVHVKNATVEVEVGTTSPNEDTTQEAVTAEAVDVISLSDADKTQETVPKASGPTTAPDVDMTQETVTGTTGDPCPVIPSATGAEDDTSPIVSPATFDQDRTPQNNRRKRPNKKWRQKASVTAVSNRFSVLTLSRNQGSNVSPGSDSSTVSTPSPPNKRIKDDPVSPPVAASPARAAPPAANGWGNFFAHIKQDDQATAVAAKEEYKRLGGDTFRPEIKETYKDQKGMAESKVHEKVGGRAIAEKEESD